MTESAKTWVNLQCGRKCPDVQVQPYQITHSNSVPHPMKRDTEEGGLEVRRQHLHNNMDNTGTMRRIRRKSSQISSCGKAHNDQLCDNIWYNFPSLWRRTQAAMPCHPTRLITLDRCITRSEEKLRRMDRRNGSNIQTMIERNKHNTSEEEEIPPDLAVKKKSIKIVNVKVSGTTSRVSN